MLLRRLSESVEAFSIFLFSFFLHSRVAVVGVRKGLGLGQMRLWHPDQGLAD